MLSAVREYNFADGHIENYEQPINKFSATFLFKYVCIYELLSPQPSLILVITDLSTVVTTIASDCIGIDEAEIQRE